MSYGITFRCKPAVATSALRALSSGKWDGKRSQGATGEKAALEGGDVLLHVSWPNAADAWAPSSKCGLVEVARGPDEEAEEPEPLTVTRALRKNAAERT